MKQLILTILIVISFTSYSQEYNSIDSLADSTCSCLYDVASNHQDKLDFNTRFSECLELYIKNAQVIDSTLNTSEKFKALVSVTLKEICLEYQFIDSVYKHYASMKELDFIVKTEDCQILRTGNYISEGDKDITIIQMNDTLQIVNFKSGAYTKSQVVWLGPCSYKIIRIESTDPYEKAMVKPGDERVIRIVKVEDKSVFTYELTMGNGGIYTGKLVKLEEKN